MARIPRIEGPTDRRVVEETLRSLEDLISEVEATGGPEGNDAGAPIAAPEEMPETATPPVTGDPAPEPEPPVEATTQTASGTQADPAPVLLRGAEALDMGQVAPADAAQPPPADDAQPPAAEPEARPSPLDAPQLLRGSQAAMEDDDGEDLIEWFGVSGQRRAGAADPPTRDLFDDNLPVLDETASADQAAEPGPVRSADTTAMASLADQLVAELDRRLRENHGQPLDADIREAILEHLFTELQEWAARAQQRLREPK